MIMYEDVVIGHKLIACRDITRINLSSVWMLANALRAIVAGWNFQLCCDSDVTGNFCSRSVDLLEFSVTSIPCKDLVLCLSIIPKATESQKVYTITYTDLRTAMNLLCQVRPCLNSDCDCCSKIRELLSAQNVVEYIGSAKFRARKLPVETAMCDNFQGFGKT
jgi:hypothetical protein